MGSSKTQLDFLDPPAEPGDLGTLGHYRVIDQLGKGGMGYVFRAEDTRLKRTVALKVMNRKVAATPNSRARFISEARAMAAVHHDNVATIFEVGEKNKTPFMAMEMLKGDTLEKFKKAENRPSFQEIIQFAKEIARGLNAAHQQGIVHRDIKPANMWVEQDSNRIKILDFGLALASTPVDQLSGRGAVVGTPGYLSPEQARSEPLDDRSDLYSAGVVLYELATGKLPLQHKSVAGQLIAILAHDPRPLRDFNPDIPQPLADLIHRLLEKEPRNRIRSAADLETELDRVAEACESSSEMAQAISRLQSGLDLLTKDKAQPELDVGIPAPLPPAASEPNLAALDLPDPFATLPPSPDAAGSGSFPAAAPTAPVPARKSTAPNKKSPQTKKRQTKKPSKASAAKSPGASKMPLIAAAVAAAIAIPVGLFFVFYEGDQPVTVADVDANNNTPVSNPGSSTDPPKDPTPPPKSNSSNNPPKAGSKNNTSNGNNKGKFTPAVPADAQPITEALVDGGTALINAQKGNGSFENKGDKPTTGSGQFKTRIPGWACILKGNKAGVANQESKAATDGSHYIFANGKSTAELNSDQLNHVTKEGDRFRVVFDIGSVSGPPKRKGKSKYTVILGFKESNGSGHRWKLGEVQDQTDIKKGMRTVGFEYVARSEDVDKKPFLRLVMLETGGNRPTSYMDNVRFVVVPKNAKQAVANRSSDPRDDPGAMPDKGMVAANPVPTPMEDVPPVNPPNSPPDGPPKTNIETPPQPSGRIVRIATSFERGADSTVKKGGSSRDTLGLKPTLAIQMRGAVEVQHSYLRFDITSITPEKQNNKKAERKTGATKLQLAVTGKTPAANGLIRVYGADAQNAQAWSESGARAINWGNSYSKGGLDQLPLLAEIAIPGDHSGKRIEIESQELADFVRNAPLGAVTLVLAGRSSDKLPLQFVSREGDPELAPSLNVQVSDP